MLYNTHITHITQDILLRQRCTYTYTYFALFCYVYVAEYGRVFFVPQSVESF